MAEKKPVAVGSDGRLRQFDTTDRVPTMFGGMPTGAILAYGGYTEPTGYLFCDGSAYLRSLYADLIAAITWTVGVGTTNGSPNCTATGIGTDRMYVGLPIEGAGIPTGATVLSITDATHFVLSANATATASITATCWPYGNGNGSGTFNVPQLGDKVPVGNGGSAWPLGSTTGAKTHTLTTGEMPSHSHGPPAPYDAIWVRDAGGGGTGNLTFGAGNLDNAVAATATAGSGSAHNNMQPSIFVNWIIKT